MKARLNNSIVISRHSLGMPVRTGEQGMAGAVRLAVGRALNIIDSILRETLAEAMSHQGFAPENGTLCSAHWNRAYIGAHQGANPIRGAQV